MKLFTKLALVSAVAVSGSAMAMESMDDSALSSATGQDGVTVTLDTAGIAIDSLFLHDNDGLDYVNPSWSGNFDTPAAAGDLGFGASGEAGAIAIHGLNITKVDPNDTFATVIIDADGSASGADPFLNIGVATSAINVTIDSIGVAASNIAPTIDATTNARRGVKVGEKTLIEDLDLSLGAMNLNVQLGNAPQGAMIAINAEVTGGIKIASGLKINDTSASGGGSITLGEIWVKDAGLENLSLNSTIHVKPTGLQISGSANSQDIYISSLALGTTDSIGSLEINGLDMGATTMTVSGH